ncbi:MAG TPA: AsmA-like C-terminal region-containing protein [Stellaceae bacterium]|nr:AsmA-like C-terminal region-containing protein [Stellaceae bacterium]
MVLGLLGAVAVLAGGAVILLVTSDLRPMVERYATRTLDRTVTIGALKIGWGNPLRVDLENLRLANTPWGSAPDMLRIDGVSAEIDLWSLLGGALRFQKLKIAAPVIVLERDTDGTGNWRFKAADSWSLGHVAVVPKDRTQFPTLINFSLQGGKVSYRTSSGSVLRVDIQNGTIHSAGDDTPVTLVLDGAYNDVPAQLTADMQSFAVLHDRRAPFGMVISFLVAASKGDFKGTMMEPLDADGVAGAIKIEGRSLGDLLNIFGAEKEADIPYSIAGVLSRAGDHWQLAEARGKLATSAFDGTLSLAEAARGKPDDLTLALDFAQLDIDPLVGSSGKAKRRSTGDVGAMSLHIDDNPAANINASINVKRLDYGTTRIADVAVRAAIVAAQVTVSQLNFAFAGGKVDASGTAHGVATGSHVVMDAALAGADMRQMSEMLGVDADQFTGKLDGAAALDMTGPTLKDALRASRGHAVVTMTQGNVARALLERASTDLRSLFRESEGSVPIRCLLGVIDLRNGTSTISPLRLRTKDAVLIGGGYVDLLGNRLDLTIKSEPASTGSFALDVPFRVSGDFAALRLQPVIGSSTAWLDAPARNDLGRELPPKLRQLAERSPCVH